MIVGIIGRGFGLRVVAPAFEQTEGCKVVDVVSPRDDEAVAALCARKDVDLVSVHSPPFLHLEHVRKAVEGGHAVLCDKPFGRDADEASAMCELAREAGPINLLNFEMRFDPVLERFRQLVCDGAVGKTERALYTSYLSVTRVPLRPHGWLFDAALGGGWLGAWGSHVVDFIRWTFGEITAASADLETRIVERPDAGGALHRCSAEDGFTARLRTNKDVDVTIESTSTAPLNLPPRTLVVGSEGALEVAGRTITKYDGSGAHEVVEGGEGGGDLALPMRRWAAVVRDAVTSGAAHGDMPTFSDGLACREVLDRLRGSWV